MLSGTSKRDTLGTKPQHAGLCYLCSNIIFFRQFVAGNKQQHKSNYVT
nr:MAG TPA: hypothetical protein [Caudoviricetes sp.]